ncbi:MULTISPECIES: hydantoinase B/oxoprolinase family protein [unclassified Rathayibacter]|uniref:hydantoinase B/oxoprolinase family protein n=1 Tax=unclassified Rathayibacter TaxID=2609250 RepID=UPI0006F77294|nr:MULTISPECIES: hydantoinase B/oxoprolinase family protein [unclassified Rathayibacter]KQQ05757.1 methylhydantoinase [Rathayibacter sp. Leaf294]KQS13615.1 methylhydantoinase [Rathayibacter sp. Leaf185]
MTDQTLNGATVEVVRSYLLAAADEMRTTLIRTAFNPVIYEVFDFGISIYDEDAELVAEAPGLTFFLGANDYSLRKGIEYVGRENLFEGDIVLLNYPYWNAAHAYDATLFAPVFLPGGEQLIGYVCVRAHWMDLGAKDPGYVLDSTDVHQEGLLFPGTKVWSRGEPVHDILELIRFNSRLPDLVLGDLHAQVSSIRTGERRLIEIVEKFGRPTVDAAVAVVRAQAEEATREALLALPQGTWSAEDLLDDDGISDDPLLMRVTVTNEGGELTIDFAGSAPAARGPVNMPFGATIALGKVVLKNLTSREAPSNEGTTVPLRVLAEPGTLFHAVYPAPTFTLWTGIVALELIYKALAQGMPDLLAASSGGDVPGFMMVGDHPDTGEFYAISNNDPVGWGASPGHDGLNATIHLSESTVRSTPLEVLEARSGMRFERMEIRTDSGGAGRFRGGNGIVRDIRFVAPGELLSVIKKTKTRPWALDGGQEPEPNRVTTFPGTEREATVSTKRVPVQAGDLIRIESAGGGGHGDPLERDPEAVRRDVAEGYVSAEAARAVYGFES